MASPSHPPLGVTQRAILARLRQSPRTVGVLSQELSLGEPGVRAKLRKLAGYGLVACRDGTGSGATYVLTEAGSAEAAPAQPPPAQPPVEGASAAPPPRGRR